MLQVQEQPGCSEAPPEYEGRLALDPILLDRACLFGVLTGDRPLITDPVLVEHIVAPCPMYQLFPGQEQVEFFQNVPKNVSTSFQLSILQEYCGDI